LTGQAMLEKHFRHTGTVTALIAVVVLSMSGLACTLAQYPRSPERGTPMVSAEQAETERELRAAVAPWLGTPYRRGGTNVRGIDCSALVMHIYQDVYSLSIPRTTKQQIEIGRKIRREHLRPGDLIFFKRTSGKRHVGIYLGHNEFAHASGTQGVTISNLHSDYWRAVYWMARRVI